MKVGKYTAPSIAIHILLIGFVYEYTFGQPECMSAIGPLYGTVDGNEYGYSLAPTLENDGFYVSGVKDDSSLLVKMNLLGEVLWSRTLDIVPGEVAHVGNIFIDSEGNLCLAGTVGVPVSGGTVFACRYNPNTHQILWAREYATHWTRNYCFSIIEKSSGGNYVMSSTPHNVPGSNSDCQLLELNRNTGVVMPGATAMYHLGSSEELNDLFVYGNHIYGAGRFTDGGTASRMRNTLVKIDPTNGNLLWTRMGHIAANQTARLYGFDLIVEADEIYSGYHGDPAGVSLTNTKLYLQKTDINGNLIWLNQYDLPGNSDFGYELIKSNDGIVVLAQNRTAPKKWILFKINYAGTIQWAKSYTFSASSNEEFNYFGRGNLIEVGGYYIFTGHGLTAGSGAEIIVMRTDQNGEVNIPCVVDQDISIPVIPVSNPVFYAVNPIVTSLGIDETSQYPEPIEGFIIPNEECVFTDTVYSFVDAIICEGDSYEGYALPGVYIDFFITMEGCDSMRTLDLEFYSPNVTSEQVEICLGTSYAGYTESGIYTSIFQDIFGCDSTHTLTLEVIPEEAHLFIHICEGEQYATYTESGFYMDTLQGNPGECDTIRYLDLMVHPHSETLLNITICDGETFEGYSVQGQYTDVFVNAYGCDSVRILNLTTYDEGLTEMEVTICPGQMYEGYALSGTYFDLYTSVWGCDSLRILTLFVNGQEAHVQATICEGQQFEGYTQAGLYQDTLIGLFGDCDTVRYLTLEFEPFHTLFLEQSICTGDSYLGYFSTGTYQDTLFSASDCDTIRILELTVQQELLSQKAVTICQGHVYEGHTHSGIYKDTLVSVFGCDSIHELVLSVELFTYNTEVQLCTGGFFQGYDQAGTYIDTLQGSGGECDTLRYLTITIQPPLLTFINAVICEGETLLGYGVEGIHKDTFQTINGCDSVRILDLTALDLIETILEITICEGDSYQGYSQTGIYEDIFPGKPGECDTSQTLALTVSSFLESIISVTMCKGQSFEGYSSTGIYTDTFQTQSGCDSIRVLQLTVNEFLISQYHMTICQGLLYEGYGDAGFYTDTFQTASGCDSVRELTLLVEVPEKKITVEICSGSSFENYTQSGIYVDMIPGAPGQCDTLREINLLVLPLIATKIDLTLCEGETYEGYGETGIYVDTLVSLAGCDSIRALYLEKENGITSTIRASVCDLNTPYMLPAGVYVDTLTSVRGCDSIRTLLLDGASVFIPNVFSPNHDGINDVFTLTAFPVIDVELEYFAIFDRFGNMVYEAIEWPVIWRGDNRKGEAFQPGVFAYVFVYHCGNQRHSDYGNITLVK